MRDESNISPGWNPVAHALMLAAACNIAGWVLSPFGWLNAYGLLVAIPLAWFALARIAGVNFPSPANFRFFRGIGKRIIRPLPAAFGLLAVLAILGGILYAPSNLDAITCRVPRVLYWLNEGRWHWIPANIESLNTRACGYEWLMAPLFAFFHTDRLLFLPNAISFLLLPGLVFSFLRHIGVEGRTAWKWMWILPSGYCFALQAGSIGNDLPAVTFALAAFNFGFLWKKSGNRSCLYLALLACGMMTAIKPTTLPLLLPFAVLFFGMWKPALASPLRSALLAVLTILASFLPTAAINQLECGDWTGAKAENPTLGTVEPLIGLAGNAVNLPLQNFAPPVFPFAKKWNAWFIGHFPEDFRAAMLRNFELNGANFAVPELQGEEWAGIGAGVSYLLLFSMLLGLRGRNSAPRKPGERVLRWWVLGGLFGFAVLAYFSRAGMSTVARHLAPYYIPMFGVALLAVPQQKLVRKRVWNIAALLAVMSAIALVTITPSRPLWPAKWFFGKYGGEQSSRIIERLETGYMVYADRSDSLGELREALPDDVGIIGFMNFYAGPELPLWKPYLDRDVRHVRPTDSIPELEKSGMTHIVLNVRNFKEIMRITPEAWVRENGGTITDRSEVRVLAKEEPSEWWVVALPSARSRQ
ncbi:MAG: hypothetical protein ABJQ29_12695 [Luteolibacter sp.]